MAQLILLVVLCASLGSSFGFILEQRQVTEVLTVSTHTSHKIKEGNQINAHNTFFDLYALRFNNIVLS